MNVLFNKVIAKDGQTAAERFAAMTKLDGVFYQVDAELYLKDVLLSANLAAEIGVEDAASYFTGDTVEAVLAELYTAQAGQQIWVHDESAGQTDWAKVYKIYQGENDFVADRTDGKTNPVLKGTINIPKDLVVKSGAVVEIFFDDSDDTLHEGSISGTDVTDLIIPAGGTATAADAGKYIKLEIQNQDDALYIAVKDLVDVYTGGTTTEATVAIDASNVITVTINKVAATKVIYQAEEGTSGDPDYKPEINVKDKIDQVETDLDALAEYVGEIPSTSQATDVIGYVDEKTAGGVGSLNGEAGIASKAGNVVTIKGGVVETEGIIDNSVSTAPATEVQGYYNPADGKFYEESTFTTEITPAGNTSYVDQAVGGKTYVWTGKAYAEVRADIVLEEVAITGAAADVSIADAGAHFTGETVEAALQEIGNQLTWNEV